MRKSKPTLAKLTLICSQPYQEALVMQQIYYLKISTGIIVSKTAFLKDFETSLLDINRPLNRLIINMDIHAASMHFSIKGLPNFSYMN